MDFCKALMHLLDGSCHFGMAGLHGQHWTTPSPVAGLVEEPERMAMVVNQAGSCQRSLGKGRREDVQSKNGEQQRK